MKIEVSGSKDLSLDNALKEVLSKIDGNPKLIIVYHTANHDAKVVQQTIGEKYPESQIAGSTTCLGVMTNAGFISKENHSLAVMAMYLEGGEFVGVGLDQSPLGKKCGQMACKNSIEAAGLEGELPNFIWYMGPPGFEEDLMKGVDEYLGMPVPFFGGSAADNDLSGNWKFYNKNDIASSGALMISFFTEDQNTPLSAFHCGHTMKESLGKVTKCNGRVIQEIDNQKAFDHYNDKTGNAFEKFKPGDSILAASAMMPIGREKYKVQEFPFYLLSHPDRITGDGGISLFTQIELGEEIYLMKGTKESLKTRAAEVLRSLLENNQIDLERVSGALIIYCAGCMLSIIGEDGITDVSREIKEILGEIPFLGAFTFGEQGRFMEEENLHGNLMISVTLFFKNE